MNAVLVLSSAFVVLVDLPQAGGGPWKFSTEDQDIKIYAEGAQAGCLKVDVITYDASEPTNDVVIGQDSFEQCNGSAPINLDTDQTHRG